MLVVYKLIKIPLVFPKGDKSMMLAPISKFNLEESEQELTKPETDNAEAESKDLGE